MLGSYLGVPVSSTHCNIGSLLGLSLAARLDAVNDVYHERKVKKENQINMGVMTKIFLWWLVTVPLVFAGTMLFSYLIINR